MIKLGDKLFNTEVYDILIKLQEDLAGRGIPYLHTIKRGQDNIMISCPYHNNGQEKRPSCGVSVKDGIVHCFACGKVSSLQEMISYCFGYIDNGEKGLEWLTKTFSSDNLLVRDASLRIARGNELKSYISEEELSSYRWYHPYMYQRRLTNEIISKFDVGFDKFSNSITFPVRDILGNTLFIARRRVDRKYFNYPSGIKKPLYGVYEMDKGTKDLIICESIFNCLTCYVYGKNAIALNGTGTKDQLEAIKKLSVRTIYIGLDNDDAGNRGAEKLREGLKDKFILKRMIFPEGKDINDLEKEEFDYIYQNAI